MAEELIRNVEHRVPFSVAGLVDIEEGRKNSIALARTGGCKMTVFSMDAGEGMSTHAASGDAMAFVLEGALEIVIEGAPSRVEAGSAIVMPKGAPHSVRALEPSKMLLVVVMG